MKIEKVLPFGRQLIEKAVGPGDIVIDATLGNGHDTLFLANLVGPAGKVYGFDIQEMAIANTKARLEANDVLDRTALFQKGHEHISTCIPPVHHGKITAAIFNLGYLPGGDKTIVTQATTTISAIKQLLEILAPAGIIVLVIYHGHNGGASEREHLLSFVKQIDQHSANVLQYQFINQVNHPPFLIAIEKN